MRKAIAILLIFLMAIPPVFSDPIEYEYVPYEEEEFPIWTMKLRRAESIFFGSMVITFPLTVAGYSVASAFGAPIEGDEFSLFWQQLGIASCFSLAIAGIDWLIGYLSD